MKKMLAFACALCFALSLGVRAQDAQDDMVRDLHMKLQQVYEELQLLQEQDGAGSSRKLQERMRALESEAQELQRRIEDAFRSLSRRNPGAERPEKGENPEFQDRLAKFRQTMQEKEQQLRELEKRLRKAAPEEAERLEAAKEELLQHIEKMRDRMREFMEKNPMQPRRHGEEGPGGPGMWDRRPPEHGERRMHDPEDGQQPQDGRRFLPEDAMRRIEKEYPEIYAHLERSKQENPQSFRRDSARLLKELQRIEQVKREDPELYKVEANELRMNLRVHELTQKIRNSRGEEREGMKKELRGVLNEMFDVREGRKALEMQRLERRMKELQQEIQTRRENKDIIVEQHMQRLIGESSAWEW